MTEKLNSHQPLQSSVLYDPSEIINLLIWCSIIIINTLLLIMAMLYYYFLEVMMHFMMNIENSKEQHLLKNIYKYFVTIFFVTFQQLIL